MPESLQDNMCALCRNNPATKTNTHYLTDAIIRRCLNMGGSNERGKGLYFEISSLNPYISFNFQQNTSVDKLEEMLGRGLNDDEILRAKKIPYSVDYVFCPSCESLFENIEKPFMDKILPQFRSKKSMNNLNIIEIRDIKTIRLFIYLQLWRSAVCDDAFFLSSDLKEQLRVLILNYKNNEINKLFPLSLTYLETPTDKEYTSNFVGFASGGNPYIIIMNDFIIQFFASENDIQYDNFFGLNSERDYRDFININEDIFKFRIIHNQQRKNLNKKLTYEIKVKPLLKFLEEKLSNYCLLMFGVYPSAELKQKYYHRIASEDYRIDKYTNDIIHKLTVDFIYKELSSLPCFIIGQYKVKSF